MSFRPPWLGGCSVPSYGMGRTFRCVTLTPRVMGIASRRKFWRARKKDKYEEVCLKRRQDFTPMIYSVDGMADKHAGAAEKRIAGMLAAKWT